MTAHHEPAAGELFARWPVTFDPPTRRLVEPAQPVIVSVSAALPGSSSTSLRDGIPLKVRAEGLTVDIKVQGTLSAWARLSTGPWIACRYGFRGDRLTAFPGSRLRQCTAAELRRSRAAVRG